MALVRIQVRRDSAANWDAANPVLAAGEPGVELDTGKFKVGDGVRAWRNLPYSSGASAAVSAPLDVGVRSSGTSTYYARADHSHALPSAVTVVSLTAGSATIAGDLSVTGSLIGGTHQHTSAAITNWSTATSDAVAANLAAGTNVTLARDPGTGVITISSSGGGSGAVSSVAGRTGDVVLTSSDMGDWPSPTTSAGKFLTTDGAAYSWADPLTNGGVSTVNDLTGSVVVAAGANVTLTTNPSTGVITIAANTTAGTGDVTSVNSLVGDLTIAAASGSGLSVAASGTTITLDASIAYADLTGVPASFTPSSHTHATTDVTGLAEFIEDTVDGLLVAGTNVTLAYDDAAGTLTVSAAGADAPTLVEGESIAIDTSVPGEAEISVDGILDGGSYSGYEVAADPAYFSIQPQSTLVTFGTALFTARVENAQSPSYQWQKADAGSEDFLALSNASPYDGVTTATLSVSPVSDSDNGDRFRLIVTTSDGSTLTSDEAVLSTVPIVITDQPLPAEFEEADTLDVEPYLLVLAEGGSTPYTYQWQKWDGSAWASVAGETAYYIDTISGTLGASEDVRVERYRVKITDDAGVVAYSDEARITIRAAVPAITLDPADQTIVSGAASMYCEYSGKGPVPSWERRDPDGDAFVAIGQSGVVTTPAAGTSRSTLSLSGLTGNDSGAQYRLRVSNKTGDAVSESATIASSAPIISSQPSDATVVENNAAAFTVVASFGGGALTYQWQEKTSGGSWANLSGATSATLTLPGVGVGLGRDGSQFRVLVTGATVTTTSKPALLTVISAPDAGDAVFSIDPANATIEEGGGYALTAVSSWLSSTSHYAAIRVEYDDGGVEYHPLSTGTAWNGTVTRIHSPLAHAQYKASVLLSRSAWVSVIASTSAPTVTSVSGSTYTLQPFAYAKFDVRDCSATVDSARPRTGVISHPVSQTLPTSCVGSVTLNVPDPPYSYVESKRARVTVAERQSFIGPVPKTGFWNPPTSMQFTGACSTNGQYVVAAATGGVFGSYLYSSDYGKTWMTRNFPFGIKAEKVIFATNTFYVFGRTQDYDYAESTAIQSTDNGASFVNTGWRFQSHGRCWPSLAGGNLYVATTKQASVATNNYYRTWNINVYKRLASGAWAVVHSQSRNVAGYRSGTYRVIDTFPAPDVGYVSYAHSRWYFRNTFSSNGTDFAAGVAADAYSYQPVSLADASQNYVLSSNGQFAPVDASGNGTSNFSVVNNGQPGAGPQAGDYVYFGAEDISSGAAFFRKGSGNPGVNEQLLGHTTFWSGNQAGEWAETQIMSYVFGSGYGPDLDMTYYNVVSDPMVEGAIFLPGKIIHLFRYRYSTSSPPGSGGGSIPVPRR